MRGVAPYQTVTTHHLHAAPDFVFPSRTGNECRCPDSPANARPSVMAGTMSTQPRRQTARQGRPYAKPQPEAPKPQPSRCQALAGDAPVALRVAGEGGGIERACTRPWPQNFVVLSPKRQQSNQLQDPHAAMAWQGGVTAWPSGWRPTRCYCRALSPKGKLC